MALAFGRIAAAALMTLALWGGARAQDKDPAVEVTEGPYSVGFTPPPGCQELSDEVKALITKEGVNLKYGCVTPQKDTLVLLMMGATDGSERALADYERGFKDSQNKLHPNIKWLGRDTVKISGGKWVRLRYREGPAENDFIHNVYFADLAGEIITAAFAAPASQYERVKAGLEKSAKSIQLTTSVIAPASDAAPPVKDKP